MYLRVQRLDAAVHHLGEAGVVGDDDDADAAVAQQLGGAAGGEYLDTACAQGACEVDDAGLVGYADEGALDVCLALLLEKKKTKKNKKKNNNKQKVTGARYLYRCRSVPVFFARCC